MTENIHAKAKTAGTFTQYWPRSRETGEAGVRCALQLPQPRKVLLLPQGAVLAITWSFLSKPLLLKCQLQTTFLS